ncbi:MAG TPA: HAMP domain-containing sensor histidine kinase [Chryseosolibacter sp.]|nr:HAMP domain-containing sensor histidine kinase [Chryseosolibacter sp.]
MKNKHLSTIIVFGSFVLAGLIVVQYYWFKKAFDVSERQFDHSVQVALKKVADTVSRDAEVKKLSSNFFFVNTSSGLNSQFVDTLVRNEFLRRGLDVEYEIGIYEADDDTLVYGNYVPSTRAPVGEHGEGVSFREAEKNFAVFFPKKRSYIAAQLDIWIFSSSVLLLMMGFFTFAIVSLLRERRFSDLKNDFINNMTHEFKTPVTNIQIAGEILMGKIADEATRAYVGILLKENRKLRDKIDDVLLGASSAYNLRPAFETVDVHRLIADCAETFQMKVAQRRGTLRLELFAKGSMVLADRELLAHAINNVIDNAEKYSPAEPIIVVRTKDAKKGIEIEIIDSGMGIEPRYQQKVFEKFFRIATGNVHNVKGFGLGLNFVRDVIQTHRGNIQLLSEPDRGTEVRIFLPVS